MVSRRTLLVLLTFLPTLVHAQARGPVGLWGGELAGAPMLAGQLVLTRTGGSWLARLAGLEAASSSTGDSALIAFPAEQGTLRLGGLDRSGTPRAFWIQPAGEGPPYATPVRLVAAGVDVWRGTVDPLPSRFSLSLQITRDSSGGLHGVFRNPDFNWNGRGRGYRIVERDGELAFLDASGREQLVQPWDSAGGTITFDFGTPLILTRRTPETAPGFTPRIAPGRYDYRMPADLGDGWPVAAAEAAGIDPRQLEAVVGDIAAADPASDTAPRIHSLLVARHGRLVLDEYFRGYAADRLHDLRSASKSFTSVMLGIAMVDHPALGPATTLRSVFADAPIDPPDHRGAAAHPQLGPRLRRQRRRLSRARGPDAGGVARLVRFRPGAATGKSTGQQLCLLLGRDQSRRRRDRCGHWRMAAGLLRPHRGRAARDRALCDEPDARRSGLLRLAGFACGRATSSSSAR